MQPAWKFSMGKICKTSQEQLDRLAAWRAKVRADPVRRAAARAYMQRWREENKARVLSYSHTSQKRWMTKADVDRIEKHDGLCDICSESAGRGKNLLVDCDGRGMFRGLLCRRCRRGIKNFEGQSEMLLRAYRYLLGIRGEKERKK